ncbi:MAG: hypothetical protein PHP62_05345 [Candidatus Moranbacteria bacterium]|nr:hypothetical protein [Candidatus Moranbacteria bacterium]
MGNNIPPKKKKEPFTSNAIRLTNKELALIAAVFVFVIFFAVPFLWKSFEKIRTDGEFRLAYGFRDDYWVYNRWADKATEKYPVVFLGDSVIWGMYVNNENTLPAKLNKKLDGKIVANLAIDGLHCVAMQGLVENYGTAIKNKKVLLHCNPLWMNSKRYDLSGNEEMSVHHPRLIPQFSPGLKCYKETFATRMSVIMERNVPFFSLINHIRLASFENEDFNQWIVDNPYKNPFAQISLSIDAQEKDKVNSSVNWTKKGIPQQNWKWLELDDSTQWSSFKNIVKRLKADGNQIYVMIGPLNPYMLTEKSLKLLKKRQEEIQEWLRKEKVESFIVSDMPSEVYADASHPLEKGYEMIADELIKTEILKPYRKSKRYKQ